MASEIGQLLDHVVTTIQGLTLAVNANVARVDFPDRELESLDQLYIDVYAGRRQTERSMRWGITRTVAVLVAMRQANAASIDDLLTVIEQLEEIVFSLSPPAGYSIVSAGDDERDNYDIETLRALNMLVVPTQVVFLKVTDGP